MSRKLSILLLGGLFWAGSLFGQTVRFRTNQGNIDVILLPDDAPLTVANFLKYVDRGAYENSFFHRSEGNFVIQGGGYTYRSGTATEIAADAPVKNEFKVSNLRGTISMAKLDNQPDSATNQWFFNVSNNSANLDTQNGGFTVFGRIANTASLSVMDGISRLPTIVTGSFDSLPLINGSGTVSETNLVMVHAIERIDLPLVDRIQTAGAYGAMAYAAPGSYVELYGLNLAGTSRSWASADFNGINAPTSLDSVSVRVNGLPAFVSYISPTQVNVQLPANLGNITTGQVVVTSGEKSSSTVSLAIRPRAGGILAPPEFIVEGRQYVVAQHADGSFVSNGRIPGTLDSPARPGETILLYGTGFGAVTPSSPSYSGQIAQGTSTLTTPVEIQIGSQRATVTYSGLGPGYVGVYQFNVVVPGDLPNGDATITVSQAGSTTGQTMWLPVRAAN